MLTNLISNNVQYSQFLLFIILSYRKVELEYSYFPSGRIVLGLAVSINSLFRHVKGVKDIINCIIYRLQKFNAFIAYE